MHVYSKGSLITLSILQAFGSFPCELSVLDIEAELDWDPAVGNINQAPVSLYDDGGVLYFK